MLYLDNSATTMPYPEVIRVVEESMAEYWGNPSSIHEIGRKAERLLTSSRRVLAGTMNAEPEEIFFTSGGTESNNLAIKGAAVAARQRGKHIITTAIEHSSVLESCHQLESLGWELTLLPVSAEGEIDLERLAEAIRKDTALVSLMQVNNEIGTVQPLIEAGKIIKGKNARTLFHVDGVQGFLKVPLDLKAAEIDFYSFSAHKFHGPNGIGALYVRKGALIEPLISGGGQEHGLRGGTENLPAIAGMVKAALITARLAEERASELGGLRKLAWEEINEYFPEAKLNGRTGDKASPYILNVSFAGYMSEVILRALEGEGIYTSAGSACSSHSTDASHVLTAIGCSADEMAGAIRFSFSAESTYEQVDYLIEALRKVMPTIQKKR